MNNTERILQYLQDNFEHDLEDIRSYLRIPSVSYTGEGIRETAEAVKGWIESLGGTAELLSFDCGHHPVVYGRIDSGAPRTLLIYGMYDVMPADEPGWIASPFGAEIHEWKGLGKCIINRGAVNTKGPLYAFFTTLRAILAVNGKLPLNLIFAIEGEEEYGAISFAQFAKKYAGELQEAEAAFFPSFGQNASGAANLFLGYKGVLYLELTCTGGEWGGPTKRGIHSSNNVWIANPVWRLVQALSTMSDKDERVTIAGFYDQVKELTPEDKELCRKLANSDHPQEVLSSNDVLRFKWNKSLEEMYYYAYGQPQLNICGIYGGYTGPGTKTLLPHKATVKMDVRLVRDMDPDEVEKLIRHHLDTHGYSDIEMRVLEKYPWSKQEINTPIVQAVINMYRQSGVEPVIHPTSLGTAPFYIFDRILKMPYCGGGMGHGGRAHSDNEYCTVDGILKFEQSMVHFFDIYLRTAR